jgi:hypothetical protein
MKNFKIISKNLSCFQAADNSRQFTTISPALPRASPRFSPQKPHRSGPLTVHFPGKPPHPPR